MNQEIVNDVFRVQLAVFQQKLPDSLLDSWFSFSYF